jgi:hypothetical protein
VPSGFPGEWECHTAGILTEDGYPLDSGLPRKAAIASANKGHPTQDVAAT